MGERTRGLIHTSRRRFLGGLGALGGSLIVGSSLPSRVVAANPVFQAEQPRYSDVEIIEEPLEEDVVSEDILKVDEDTDLFRGLRGFVRNCKVQASAAIMRFRKNPAQAVRNDHPDGTPKFHRPIRGDPNNPGDIIVGPASDQELTMTAFNNVRVSREGNSLNNPGGLVLFKSQGDPRYTRRLLEFNGERDPNGKLLVTVDRKGGKPISKPITCDRKQRFPILIPE